MPSSSEEEYRHEKAAKKYLSPAAASTLISSFDTDEKMIGDLDSTVASSAPSSPKGSVSTASSSSSSGVSTPLERQLATATAAVCYDRLHEDPYADVRERMEALSLRDKLRFAYHNTAATEGDNQDENIATMMMEPVKACDPHQDITVFAAITTYLGYIVLIVTGHIRDICASIFRKGRYFRSANNKTEEQNNSSASNYPSDDFTKYAPLLKSWENFYTRRLYHRIQDCFNRPIASRPCAIISVLERVSFDGNKTMSILGKLSNLRNYRRQSSSYENGEHYDETHDGRVIRRCLNLGSYNYLGFADDWDITCREGVTQSLINLPSSVGSSRLEYGTTSLHRSVERIVASFVGKEDAVVLNMGFNTNATIIPTLMTSGGDLIVSDELNHTSIVNGARASGAAIRTFRHNDSADLELTLREAIVYGQPRTRRPWNRILVVVEGIYSMEGEYCDLRNIVSVSKKYGAYVYLDEAHSIGAMGPTGRGCCEYTGVDPSEVDVLMGTFTKSFGGMGGYVAADKRVIDILRKECAGSAYHNSLSPVVCQQIISSFQVRWIIFISVDYELNVMFYIIMLMVLFPMMFFSYKTGYHGKRWNKHRKTKVKRSQR
jgi:serine palmitoyltransferase